MLSLQQHAQNWQKSCLGLACGSRRDEENILSLKNQRNRSFLRLRRPGKTSLFYKPSNRLNQKIKDRLCRFFQDSLNLNVLTESKRETNCKRIMETQKNEKLWRLHDKKQPHHVQIDLAMTVACFDSLSSIYMLLLMLFCLILFMDFMELPH